jgi:dienelactone hydrolase/uncharacterized protein YndB with AHSA1/START domain
MKKFLTIFAIVIVILVLGSFLLPAQTRVERSIIIEAPSETVYPYVANFSEFNKWSPWAKRDPQTEYRFEGPATGVGAKMHWNSQDPQVGSGSQEIIAAEPPSRVQVALQFGEDMGPATASYILEPQPEASTKVTWSFDADHGHNPLSRIFGLMMDGWVGPDYEQGLDNLKQLVESQAVAAIGTKEMEYEVDGVKFTGYLAYPAGEQPGKNPGVLIVHEWWGHNEYVRQRAEQLAKQGYTAFALDMYGDNKHAHHPDDAMKFMNEVASNAPLAKNRFDAALELLKTQEQTDPARIAAIGYCFGGAVVLNMARMGADVQGVVSFHGNLQPITPAKPGTVKAKVLVLNGADDPFVPVEQRTAFKAEMDAAGVDYEFVDYPGAVHSFTSPFADAMGKEFNLPLAYNAAADADSWQRMLAFFGEIFAIPPVAEQ